VRIRQALVTLISVTLLAVMTVPPASASANSVTCVTRQQFMLDFDEAASISPVYPATPTFSDVPAASPYYGYIEAAVKAGIINGTSATTFSPLGCLTRAQIAKVEVLGLGFGAEAMSLASHQTAFSDDATIPSWARGYVAEAVALGLVHGYPDNTYRPGQFMTASDEGFFIAQYKTAAANRNFAITASSTTVGSGQQVTLSASGTTQSVTYSVNSTNAVISGSTFVATEPGTYVVTGTTSDGARASLTITVYGAPATLRIVAPSTIVANGSASETVSVDVVDASGNTVGDASDSITISGYGQALNTPTSTTVSAVNGVATFTFRAGTVAGGTDTLTAKDNTDTSLPTATAQVSAAPQVATSIQVTMPQSLPANTQGTTAQAYATVVDQAGIPILTGSYSLTATVTGPASLDASGDKTITGAYVGNGTATNAGASFTLYNVQGSAGTITLTVTAAMSGVKAGTGTTQAVFTGAPVAFKVTQTTSSANADTVAGSTILSPFDTITITPVDRNGNETSWSGTAKVTETLGGTTSGNVVMGGSASGTLAEAFSSQSSQTVPLYGQGNGTAGTYTFTVTDEAGNLTSATVTVTVMPGAVSSFKVSPTVYVGASSPSAPIWAQLYDAEGNPVTEAGVTVDFTAPTNASVSSATATTNADGKAQVTATVPLSSYQTFGFTVKVPSLTTTQTAYIDYASSTVASQISITATPPYQVTAGSPVSITFTAKDQYNNQVTTNDILTVTLSGTGSLTPTSLAANSDGTWTVDLAGGTGTVTATAYKTGTVRLSAVDTSVATQPTGSYGLSVLAGAWAGWALVTSSGAIVGNDVGIADTGTLTVAANSPVALTLEAVDAYGNLTVYTTSSGILTLSDSHGGAWRTSPTGTDVTSLSVTSGFTERTLYYVNGTAQSNITMDGDVS